ncbi:MAG: hypothetical protein MUD17_01460 [Gemmatimonadaceae bacterium]|nr:hypothetical protein [Gemmatimonadaceae bacterium]
MYEIGGLEENGATELSTNQARISGAFLPSGGIAIADVTRVLFVSGDGRVLGSVGRAGGGPGEFREIGALCTTRGDTVVVTDGNQNRLTVLAPPGRLVRVVPHDLSRSMQEHGCFADGRLLIARDADRSKPISSLAPFEVDLLVRTTRAWPVMRTAQMLDLVTQPRVSLVTGGTRVYFADGQRSEVRVIRRDGQPIRTIAIDEPILPISAGDRERALDKTIPRNVQGAARRAILSRDLARPSRPTWPTLARLLPERNGRLWIQRYRKTTETSPFAVDEWIAVDSTGRTQGRLVLPPPVLRDRRPTELLDIQNDRVLIKRVDDDGAVRIAVHRLTAATAPNR